MATRIPALVEPTLLKWARERASLSTADAAHKIGVELQRLEAWESGQEGLSIPQLKKLADVYKRPLSVFFLPEPPRDFQALKDLRRLQVVPGQMSRELTYEIRAAQERRLVAVELADEFGDALEDFGIAATLTENPEVVAQRVRELLRITVQQQAQWKTHDQTFRGWRDMLEASGVLVSVLGGAHHKVPIDEVRGFAIAERPFPMIVVNGQDKGYGRVFTLLHELPHIILGEGVLEDDIEPGNNLPPASRMTETFCNRLAAAILMPREALLAEMIVAPKASASIYSDAELSALATRYGVSREAMLVRLAELNRVSQAFVQAKRAELARLYAAQRKIEDEEISSGFPPPTTQLVYHVGRGYVRLVLQAYHSRRLTLSAASGYLGAQAKLIPKIERATFGNAAIR